jgi:hypothetical protein
MTTPNELLLAEIGRKVFPPKSYDFDTDTYVMANGETWTGEALRAAFPMFRLRPQED